MLTAEEAAHLYTQAIRATGLYTVFKSEISELIDKAIKESVRKTRLPISPDDVRTVVVLLTDYGYKFTIEEELYIDGLCVNIFF